MMPVNASKIPCEKKGTTLEKKGEEGDKKRKMAFGVIVKGCYN
tara:strand:+ start:201 stop:329 length:129 start_codon:yes stop_codon:yes gene_type:complete